MTRVRVVVDSPRGSVPVGTARITRLRGIETTEFTYDDSFLAAEGWSISPDLPIHVSGSVLGGLPGALDDSAPDSWGRSLITRRLASQSRDDGHAAGTTTELEYLLGVDDLTRQGALRFRLGDDDPFLADGHEIPRLLDLETLLDAAARVATGDDVDDAVATLLDAGSGSLGGARPKAPVTDGTSLFVAKFPHRDDQWEVIRWEAVALDLAQACGLDTPSHDLVEVGQDPVLLVERFDRTDTSRIPYLSGRSLIGAGDVGARDYLELVDAMTEHGGNVGADLVELWRRIAFSIAINNTDDHMRNHGFLRTSGWTLAPIFDVNPNRRIAAARHTSVAGATEAGSSLAALFDVAGSFGLNRSGATQMWTDLVAGTRSWRKIATRRGISAASQDDFASVFDRWDKD